MIITQTQIEALASFFSSISITSFVRYKCQSKKGGEPDSFSECEDRELTRTVTLQSLHKLRSIEALRQINY
jgi:hypothetical protein